MNSILLARGINKRYGGATALAAAHFELRRGEVHALMGENGAGKSTLARILAGSVRADSADIMLDSESISIRDARHAQSLGIGIIYQELDLFPHLTVGENLVIGNLRYPKSALVSHRRIEAFCRPFLDQVGLSVDTRSWAALLSIAQQQLLVIARTVSMNCRILLMDEPTSALSEDAAERLFAVIAALKARGVAIVYVSHKMQEIFRLCDRLTVLRDGKTIATRDIGATNRDEVIRFMVGRDIDTNAHRRTRSPGAVALSVEHLNTQKLKDVSFEVRRGEVLGIAGLMGAGRSELGAALFGLDRIQLGRMTLNGKSFSPRTPAQVRRHRLALVPEDRKLQGLMPQMSVQENTTLSVLSQLARCGIISETKERALFNPLTERLRLKCAGPDEAVSSLSGGNQQKVLLARWLASEPDVLFLDDPARGIDIAAKEDIYQLIDELAAEDKTVILASSELSELLRCSDRILVLNNGRVAGNFLAREATPELIMAAATRTYLAEGRLKQRS